MQGQLAVRIDAARDMVWQALAGDLAASGPHVEVLAMRAPEELRLVARTAPGERMHLRYLLDSEGVRTTIVRAEMRVEGGLYIAKKLLSFGVVDRAYLRLLAVGLDNLRGAFLPRGADVDTPAP
jgi:hypothetical protein